MLTFDTEQREWLARQFEELTTELVGVSPSAWAEAKRYLPPQVTSLPGFYRFEVAPYLREIVDCLGVESPIREVTVQKGAQVGVTVGVLENCIGYLIDEVRTAPVMMVTADAELAKLRMESYVTPMLQLSGLEHLIKSADEKNTRKTGKTDKKLEWTGGGFLVPFGAQNANKLRSISVQYLLEDEVDGWPDVVGKDGDPEKLVEDRTAAYEGSRKILRISTPLIKGTSKIAKRFEQGDQRRYFVCCLSCGYSQTLRWRRTDAGTGVVTGIVWDTENGRIVPDSVRFLCENCSHEHFNDDKTRLLSPENGAEWRPAAIPSTPHHRSYHLSALYSPVGMQTWAACAQKWSEAWDDDANRAKDLGALQVFYNNVLGEPFELRGERVKLEAVSEHKRDVYKFGEIPNKWAREWCGSPVLFLTCTVDVHKESLKVAVFGWCRARRAFLISYESLDGDTEQLDDPGTWVKLREIIEQRRWKADDGSTYWLPLTLIDSGYRADQVYRFCGEYQSSVFPLKGVDAPPKGAKLKEFSQFTTPNGLNAYNITVDLYKDRWHAALKHGWDRQSLQPAGHFNAPSDISEKQLKELTAEVKRERIDPTTKQRIGFEWVRPHHAPNELWDLLIYADAAHDLIAWEQSREMLDLEATDYEAVDELLERQRLFFEPSDNKDGSR